MKLDSIECGRWKTVNGTTEFTPYYFVEGNGSISKEGTALVAKMTTCLDERHDLIMDFSNIRHLSLSGIGEQSALTFTLILAPKIFKDKRLESETLVEDLLPGLRISMNRNSVLKRYRTCGLPGSDVTGTCLTYRFVLQQTTTDLKSRLLAMTGHQIPIKRTRDLPIRAPLSAFRDQVSDLDADIAQRNYSFGLKFQINTLWANAVLSPSEVRQLLPAMEAARMRSGETTLIEILKRLVSLLPYTYIEDTIPIRDSKTAVNAMIQPEEFLLQTHTEQPPARDEVPVHRATVTPTGIYLYGPEMVVASRVLRQYRAHQDFFLRVLFVDENGEMVRFGRDSSNETVMQRFRHRKPIRKLWSRFTRPCCSILWFVIYNRSVTCPPAFPIRFRGTT